MNESASLPAAVPRMPDCGVCGKETWSDGDGDVYRCEDCALLFDQDTLHPRFADPTAPLCGAPCVNRWHEPNRIRPGVTFTCRGCALPDGHESNHWTGCQRHDPPGD